MRSNTIFLWMIMRKLGKLLTLFVRFFSVQFSTDGFVFTRHRCFVLSLAKWLSYVALSLCFVTSLFSCLPIDAALFSVFLMIPFWKLIFIISVCERITDSATDVFLSCCWYLSLNFNNCVVFSRFLETEWSATCIWENREKWSYFRLGLI